MKNKYTHKLTIMVILAISIGCSATAVAQDKKQITGTVSDNTGPLLGASILIKNTSQGTSTDIDGTYSIQATPSDTLVFSYLGLLPQEIPVNLQTRIDVILNTDETSLDEVVINAGYYKVSERERTGSISRITATEIENQPVSNPLATMQGRMAGVNIIETSGMPGSDFSIKIRGRNSIRDNGNEPLYIIDGVPFLGQSLGNGTVSTPLGGSAQSPMNGINPQDIKSIEILKDADATAIYGSRGANGVVLITTKRGKTGKTQFNIQSTTGAGRIDRRMKLLNTQQYLKLREDAFANDGFTVYPDEAYDINGTWDRERFTDWQKVLLGGTANYTTIMASVQGGDHKNSYLINGNFLEQTTVLPGDFKNNKISFLANFNHKTKNEKINVHFNTNYVLDNNDLPASNLVREALTLPPNAPALYDADGNLNWENSSFNNPLAELNGKYLSNGEYFRASTVISFKPFENFEFKTNLGYNQTGLKESRTAPNTLYNPALGLDSGYSLLILNDGSASSYIVEPQANYNLKTGNNQWNFIIGSTIQNDRRNNSLTFASDFPSNNLIYNPAAATNLSIDNYEKVEYRYKALFGRINFKHNKKYIVNLTARRDGSSRFGPGKQFANFGAVGIAYIFSEEKMFQDIFKFLSHGKIRGSYGTTGNDQIGNYGFLNTYGINSQLYQGIQTISPVQLLNRDFGWERNKKIEGAIEIGFLDDNIFLSASYYRNQSSNQLVGIPLPGTTGFEFIQGNMEATVQNKGIELELNAAIVKNRNFNWNSSVNLTIPRNKLISFPNLEASSYAHKLIVGQPLDIMLLYEYTGVDPETGLYTFTDANEDGIINSPADRVAAVNAGPVFYGGFSNSLSYKNLTLDFLFQFTKQQARNYFYGGPLPGTMANLPIESLDYWQQTNPTAPHQMVSAGYNNEVYQSYVLFYNSTGAVGDASFVRLKNIALSYVLPIPDKLMCRLSFSAQNLLTFTKYIGPDPETLAIGNLPPLKIFSAGVDLKF